MFMRIKAFFMSLIMLITAAFPSIFGGTNKNVQEESLIRPETWAAVDGLGRTLPSAGEVRDKNDQKFVAMFYWTWHTKHANNLKAKNVTEILKEHPEIAHDFDSPLWESESFYSNGRPFYWGEPVWGYYSDRDEYVIRKNAELLADAGVDVIIFDATNGTLTWDEDCLKLFEGMVSTMQVNKENMAASSRRGFTNATDAADYLVKNGVPFRDAHGIIGQLVLLCIDRGIALDDLPLEEYQKICPVFKEDIYEAISMETCVSLRQTIGAPGKEAMEKVIAAGEAYLNDNP